MKLITRWLPTVILVVVTISLGVGAGCAVVWLDDVSLAPEPVPVKQIEVVEKELPVVGLAVVKAAIAPTKALPDLPAPEEPEDPAPAVEPAYTEEELELLALVIYQEAGADACSDETRQMVGEVALNRVTSDRYPDTLAEVLTQRQQYGRLYWTGLVWPERAAKPEEAHAVARAYETAEALLAGTVERLLPEDVIYQAEFPQGTEIVAEVKGFYFCR